MLAHHRLAKMAFRWRAYNGPLIVVFGPSSAKKEKNKKVAKVGPL